MRALGLDVGGANVKAALVVHSATGNRTAGGWTLPFELFRDRDGLAGLLESLRWRTKPDGVALTMTGELCDCYKSRSAGARWILRQVETAMAGLQTTVFDCEGDQVSMSRAMRLPLTVASANWAVTLRWAAENGLDNGLVVDIGSTTTDILPVKNGAPAARGRDDYSRAGEGELVYTGYLRTHASIVAPRIVVRGKEMDSCPEYFAIAGDAYLVLGDINARQYTCPTPDGGARTKAAAARRLCRMALSDLESLGMEEAINIARQVASAHAAKLTRAVDEIVMRETWGMKVDLSLIGPGGFILEKAMRRRREIQLVGRLGGSDTSNIDPAWCAAMLYSG